MVEAAAEHEVDTGPTAEEAAALLAEQQAGAPTDAEIEARSSRSRGRSARAATKARRAEP